MEAGKGRLEDVLDIVDQRTLIGLLKLAGLALTPTQFPRGAEQFLSRQAIISDEGVLVEVSRLLKKHKLTSPTGELRFKSRT